VVFNAKGSDNSSELNILLPAEQVGLVTSSMPVLVPGPITRPLALQAEAIVGVLVPLVSKAPETSDIDEDENRGASVPEAAAPGAQYRLQGAQRDLLLDPVCSTLYLEDVVCTITCPGLKRREEGWRKARVGVRTVRNLSAYASPQ
jgi:hypothetical protein